MRRNDWERKGRLFHRWIGISAVGFLLLSVGTGLLWANARFLYWEDRYKEKLQPLPPVSLDQASLPLSEIPQHVYAIAGNEVTLDQVTLKSDFGVLLYEVRVRKNNTKQTLLLDARTAEALSPISEDLAAQIARQYVREAAAVTQVTMESYVPRKKHTAVDAVRISFDDSNHTQIILDRQTGDILEDEGRWRRLHFFVMQLHQLNFFGFEKTLLNIPGVPLLLMGISGALVWALQWTRARRTRAIPSPQRASSSEKVLETAPEH